MGSGLRSIMWLGACLEAILHHFHQCRRTPCFPKARSIRLGSPTAIFAQVTVVRQKPAFFFATVAASTSTDELQAAAASCRGLYQGHG
jgi:hypothetical protein